MALTSLLHTQTGPELASAIELAGFVHDGRTIEHTHHGERYTDPWAIHPIRTALRILTLLDERGHDLALLQAAVLHDVSEHPGRIQRFYCPPYTPAITTAPETLLTEHFSQRTAHIIAGLADPLIGGEQIQILAAVDVIDHVSMDNYDLHQGQSYYQQVNALATRCQHLPGLAGALARTSRVLVKKLSAEPSAEETLKSHTHEARVLRE